MDDADLVRVPEALQHLDDDRDLAPEVEGGLVAQDVQEVAALQQLHDDVGRAVGVVAEIEDRHDVRVHHPRDGPSFALEAQLVLRLVRELREHHLERDVALEVGIEGLEDGSHAPPAEEPHDAVLADRLGVVRHRRPRPWTEPLRLVAATPFRSPTTPRSLLLKAHATGVPRDVRLRV